MPICGTASLQSVRNDAIWPPVAASLTLDAVLVGGEVGALTSDNGVAFGQSVEMPIPSGMSRPGELCQPALSSTSRMIPSQPAPASRAKSASTSLRSPLETLVERYQKLSPVTVETEAVT